MKLKVRSSLSWFLSVLLVLTMMPAMGLTAYAVDSSATVGDVTVSGEAGHLITPKSVELNLTNESFTDILADADVSTWFTNLPAGLSATIGTGVTSGADNATVTISGTPTEGSVDAIAITIPGSCLTGSQSITVTENNDAKYAVMGIEIGDVTVSGTVGTAITDTDVTLTLVGTRFSKSFAAGSHPEWIRNLPNGLTMSVKNAVSINATTATLTISGTPEEGSDAAITFRIYGDQHSGSSFLTGTTNANAKYAIEALDPSATVGNVTVSGKVGTAITDTDVVLTLENEKFVGISADTDVTSWFSMPAGLSATVKETVALNGTSATITISGTPEEASDATMAILIPAAYISGTSDLSVTANSDAKFTITASSSEGSGGSSGGGRTSGGRDGGISSETPATVDTPSTTDTPATTPETPVTEPVFPETPAVTDVNAPVAGFTDVKAGDFFAEPVRWAVSAGITKGAGETTFEPDRGCTRAETVTFMWRAEGCPEPTATVNPFKDVKSGDYFSKAVLWGIERGIVKGTSETTFSPDLQVNRAQAVTFLYRAKGGAFAAGGNNFTDVSDGVYYTEAVNWAAGNGITTGTSRNTFSPAATCNRGQTVTFLYRANN